jgi:ubiquinone/menaquinone biosynthesis C-methylase UbiE
MTPFGRTDYERMAEVYDLGRALPLDSIAAWRAQLDPYLSSADVVLDLGAGTGLWEEAFTAWFDVTIVAVEPSEALRAVAAEKQLGDGAVQIGGAAERIPLRDHACDVAWLSTVVHHVGDLHACAAELHRVLRDGCAVLVRNSFGDRLDGIHWLEYFPPARVVAARRWPSVAATVEVFESARFRVEGLRRIPEMVAPDLHAYYERLSVRANSTLTFIQEAEFRAGLDRLRSAAERTGGSSPVVDLRDLLVLRRTP